MARDFAGLERRRLQAAKLFKQGCSQSEVARQLKVSRQSASRWYYAWQKSGQRGLKAAGRAGRLPRLTASQLKELERFLIGGPSAFGYATQLWTLPRIAKVIHELFGVRYHPGHVWRILRQLGFSCQKPVTRAKGRDEVAIRQWRRQRWPQIKKGRKGKGPH